MANFDDCVLGFDTQQEYDQSPEENPYFGSTVGRVANRLKNSQYTLEGKTVKVDQNHGKHSLHGGENSMYKQFWETKMVPNGVEFSYLSNAGENGYPSTVLFKSTYTLERNQLSVHMEAEHVFGDEPCPINMINHTYFNLTGHKEFKHILEH